MSFSFKRKEESRSQKNFINWWSLSELLTVQPLNVLHGWNWVDLHKQRSSFNESPKDNQVFVSLVDTVNSTGNINTLIHLWKYKCKIMFWAAAQQRNRSLSLPSMWELELNKSISWNYPNLNPWTKVGYFFNCWPSVELSWTTWVVMLLWGSIKHCRDKKSFLPFSSKLNQSQSANFGPKCLCFSWRLEAAERSSRALLDLPMLSFSGFFFPPHDFLSKCLAKR